MKKILVEYGKYMTYYYDVTTDEQLAEVALHILQNNFENGYYPEPEEDIEPEGLLTQEQIDALPTEEFKRQAYEARRAYDGTLRRIREYRDWYTAVERVVENHDTKIIRYKGGRTSPLAWNLLQMRGRYEYDRYSIEDLEEVG